MGGRRWRGPVAIMCIAALGVGMTACGKDDPPSKADATTSSSTSTTSSSTTTSAPATTTSTTAASGTDVTVTADSFGALHLGMTFEQAKATGLIDGDFTSGCEVASPPPMGANLKAPLDGAVSGSEGKVTAFDIRSGYVTSPGGIRKGDTLAKVQAALAAHDVQVDKGSEDTFGIWFVNVLDHGKELFSFGVDPATQRVGQIGVPYIAVCD